MTYNIILIDPRPASKEAMIALLEKEAPVWGIEFTLPDLLPYIDINLDGQHFGNSHSVAACEYALDCDLPNANTTLAIVRPDTDALMAAAILDARSIAAAGIHGYDPNDDPKMLARVKMIAKMDKFDHGDWPGRDGFENVSEDSDTKALGIIASNFKMPIEDRVRLFMDYLKDGSCRGLEEAKEQGKATLEKLLNESKISYPDNDPDCGLVIVESAHIGATGLGYRHAPVVIVKNDAFRFAGGEPHLKYTVCAWKPKYVDFKALTSALNEKETSGTWGGSASIVGSPQGVSSSLTIDEIVSIVKANML